VQKPVKKHIGKPQEKGTPLKKHTDDDVQVLSDELKELKDNLVYVNNERDF